MPEWFPLDPDEYVDRRCDCGAFITLWVRGLRIMRATCKRCGRVNDGLKPENLQEDIYSQLPTNKFAGLLQGDVDPTSPSNFHGGKCSLI